MNNHKHPVIEFARFTLAEGVDEPTLVAAADALQEEFLRRQSGFLRRELVKTADNEWADVIYWENRQSVERAMQKAPENPAALRYFQLMANTGQDEESGHPLLMSVTRSYS